MALGLSVATMETKGNNALNSEEKINFNLEICTQAKCDNRTKTFQPQKLFWKMYSTKIKNKPKRDKKQEI